MSVLEPTPAMIDFVTVSRDLTFLMALLMPTHELFDADHKYVAGALRTRQVMRVYNLAEFDLDPRKLVLTDADCAVLRVGMAHLDVGFGSKFHPGLRKIMDLYRSRTPEMDSPPFVDLAPHVRYFRLAEAIQGWLEGELKKAISNEKTVITKRGRGEEELATVATTLPPGFTDLRNAVHEHRDKTKPRPTA